MGNLRGKKILVVDDDVNFLNLLMLVLEREGATVLLAEGEEEASAILKAHKPDIAICDLMMEHIDGGFALCNRIKKIYPGTPVIVATNTAVNTGIEFTTGADEDKSWRKVDLLLSKPVRLDHLKREIKRLLRGLSVE